MKAGSNRGVRFLTRRLLSAPVVQGNPIVEDISYRARYWFLVERGRATSYRLEDVYRCQPDGSRVGGQLNLYGSLEFAEAVKAILERGGLALDPASFSSFDGFVNLLVGLKKTGVEYVNICTKPDRPDSDRLVPIASAIIGFQLAGV